MTARLIIVLVLLASLAGCARVAESRFNPFNWFGRSQSSDTLVPVDTQTRIDPRGLVAEVTALTVERTPGGAVVRAVGLPATQGYFEGELVPETEEVPADGVLAFQFRIFPPFEPTRASTQRSREVVVATFVSNQMLAQVREIRVIGRGNIRSSRR